MPHAESAPAVPRRRWMLFAPFLVVVVLAAGWSALWFYAAGRAEADLAAWRESERQAGRTQHCASQSSLTKASSRMPKSKIPPRYPMRLSTQRRPPRARQLRLPPVRELPSRMPISPG